MNLLVQPAGLGENMAEVSNWMHVDVFTVDQAAALWCGFDPVKISLLSYKNPPEFAATKQMLFGAILNEEIHSDSSKNMLSGSGDFSATLVPRSELEKFAKKKGLFPAFLFDTLAPFAGGDARTTGSIQETVNVNAVPDPAPSNVKKGGRPTEYDWDSFMLEVIRRANTPDGLPDSQAELVREMLQWFADTFGNEPAESSIKSRISRVYKYLANAKAKDNNPDA